ncbi:MAG: sulfite exporter TauE/SafE family protein [Candidatus Cloacimonetes bacterium]|nr:sulfite exporter TauE/SafE family protein [Candidatus Cloacimonadota bacterium]
MITTFLQGWALGLATGTTCLATCAPIYIPYLLAEKRSDKESLQIIILITLGRFFSYLAFGAVFGYAGSHIPVHSRQIFTAIAYVLLSIYLVITVFRVQRQERNCITRRWMKITKNPFLLGVFTGISFCPAFLIAISQAIEISGPIGGLILFLAFFLGTSLFILPMTFFGALSRLTIIRKIAVIASLLVVIIFTYKGVNSGISYFSHRADHKTSINENDVTEPFLISRIVYVTSCADEEKNELFREILEKDSVQVTFIDNELSARNIPEKSSVIYLAEGSIDYRLLTGKALKIIKLDISNFNISEDFNRLLTFLHNVYFKYNPAEGYEFHIRTPPAGRLIDQGEK